MTTNQTLISKNVYRLVSCLLVGLFLVVALPWQEWKTQIERNERVRATKVISHVELVAAVDKVKLAMREKARTGTYTPEQYVRDGAALHLVESNYNKGFQAALTITNPVRDEIEKVAKPAGTLDFRFRWRATREYNKLHEKGLISTRAVINFVLGCLRLYLLFIPVVLVIFLLRIATTAKRLEEAIAIVYWDRSDLAINLLIWPLALEWYEPRQTFEQVVKGLVHWYRLNNESAYLEAVKPGTAAVQLLEAIWLSDPRILVPKPWQWQWRQAIYISTVATLYLVVGEMCVYAADVEKHEPLDLKMGIATHFQPERGKPMQALRLIFHGRTELLIVRPHRDPTVEITQHVFNWKGKSGFLEAGPLLSFRPNGRVEWGVDAFGVLNAGKWTLKGPFDLTLTDPRPADFDLAIPKTTLTYKVGKRLGIGVGGGFFATSQGSSCVFGPALQYQALKHANLHIRLGRWLTGNRTGQSQLRLDLVLTP